MVGIRKIRSEKLREHQFRGGYARSLEGERVDWDGDNNVKHMWEQVKRAMMESAGEVCISVRMGGKNPKSVCSNYEAKNAVRRKEGTWKEVLAASDEDPKERYMKAYRAEKRKVKRSITQSKRK